MTPKTVAMTLRDLRRWSRTIREMPGVAQPPLLEFLSSNYLWGPWYNLLYSWRKLHLYVWFSRCVGPSKKDALLGSWGQRQRTTRRPKTILIQKGVWQLCHQGLHPRAVHDTRTRICSSTYMASNMFYLSGFKEPHPITLTLKNQPTTVCSFSSNPGNFVSITALANHPSLGMLGTQHALAANQNKEKISFWAYLLPESKTTPANTIERNRCNSNGAMLLCFLASRKSPSICGVRRPCNLEVEYLVWCRTVVHKIIAGNNTANKNEQRWWAWSSISKLPEENIQPSSYFEVYGNSRFTHNLLT